MSGLFLFGGLLSGVFLLVPVILVLALLVILALRHDDDVDGSRAPAIYGALIAFIALLTILFAATGIATSLASVTSDDTRGAIGSSSSDISISSGDDFIDSGSGSGSRFSLASEDDNDAAVTSAVGFLIAGLVGLGLLLVHRPFFARRATATGAALRVHRAYLLVLCLVAAIIAAGAAGAALYAIYRALFPDTAGSDNRADELRALVPLLVLLVGAAGLWRWHWRQLDLGQPAAPEPDFSAAGTP